MKKITIEIEGMSCMGCVRNVEKSLKELKGVEEVEVSLEDKKAVVEVSEDISSEDLKSKIKEAGYNPVKIIQNEN